MLHVPIFINFTFIHTQLILLINLYRSLHNLFTIALIHLFHFSSNELTVLFSWFSRIHLNHQPHLSYNLLLLFYNWIRFFRECSMEFNQCYFIWLMIFFFLSSDIGWMWIGNHVVVEDYRSSFFTLYSIQFDNEC